MRQYSKPPFVQIMTFRLIGAKPLSEPMFAYYGLDPREQNAVKFQSIFIFFSLKQEIAANC